MRRKSPDACRFKVKRMVSVLEPMWVSGTWLKSCRIIDCLHHVPLGDKRKSMLRLSPHTKQVYSRHDLNASDYH